MSIDSPSVDQDEPETPTWFSMLGVAIFLFGGIFALVASQGDPELATDSAAQAPAGVEDEAAPEPNAAPPTPEAAPAPSNPLDPHAGHGH